MRNVIKKAMTWALICGACALTATSSWGVTVNLRAEQFIETVPLNSGLSTNITMWGFALDAAAPSVPGPTITILPGETELIINLANNLTVPISIVIPGQDDYVRGSPAEHGTFVDPQGRTRARSFVKETPPGGVNTYIWNNLRPGTYLYHSGSHPALQVQMGLYGMLKQDVAVGEVYAGVSYATETNLIFGEIDFDVHDAVQVGAYGTTVKSMIHTVPEIYLLNGEPYQVGELTLAAGQTKLVRLLNACYDERAIVLNGAYGTVIAEDGRKYPYPKVENAINLPALKTRDALLVSAQAETVKFFDRRILANIPPPNVPPPTKLIVDNADGTQWVEIVGVWNNSTAASGYWGIDYLHDGNTAKGAKSVRFTPSLPFAGQYQVAIRYTAAANRSTRVPVDIVTETGTTTVLVNQRVNGSQWVILGTYAFAAGTSGSVLIRTTGTTDGYVIADAVRFLPVVVVDNADGPASVNIVGTWTPSTSTPGYLGINYLHDGNIDKGTKSVSFTPNLPFAGQYEVAIRYTAGANRSTHVPVDIVSATGTATVSVNQRVNGGQWVVLGTYGFTAGTSGSVLIRTTGTTDGYVIADALSFGWVGP